MWLIVNIHLKSVAIMDTCSALVKHGIGYSRLWLMIVADCDLLKYCMDLRLVPSSMFGSCPLSVLGIHWRELHESAARL